MIRQGYPLSLLLFSVLLGDLDEKMGREEIGGTILVTGKVYSLAYA